MAKLLRKALGLFVQFDDEKEQNDADASPSATTNNPSRIMSPAQTTNMASKVTTVDAPPLNFKFKNEDLDKFEDHFEKLMDEANLPGPDYYEFCKMMEALESAVPDTNARMAAVFVSLKTQGLDKSKLIETANQYKIVIGKDKDNFDGALTEKTNEDIASKKQQSADLQKKIVDNNATIEQLKKEITDAQIEIDKLKQDIDEGESKLASNQRGYILAYNAMINKINVDIDLFQKNIQ